MTAALPPLPAELGAATRATPVPGGDINAAWRVELADGRHAFVKHRPGAPAGEYATEAAGLRWLAEPGALRLPRVLAVSDAALALEWVDEGRLDAAGEEELGRGLAELHAAGAPAFGGAWPLRLGAVVLSNEPLADWPAFYAERRLRPLAAQARDRGALSAAGAAAIERVCERIDELAGPPEPPARIHGDLWSGNVLAGADGRPWLIDPAAHGGHREVDLAMLRLFGAPSPRVLAAYQEARPLAAGHDERVALWQLLPLLVHAVLFGGGYGASAERAARRYG
ncbi:MAG TPA: fructosamine kinase family protein [Capillimicrobium sp.]|nr:fructosamine kinase family protein [Capillimicrobium sp.]